MSYSNCQNTAEAYRLEGPKKKLEKMTKKEGWLGIKQRHSDIFQFKSLICATHFNKLHVTEGEHAPLSFFFMSVIKLGQRMCNPDKYLSPTLTETLFVVTLEDSSAVKRKQGHYDNF